MRSEDNMKKLILASAAAFLISISTASAHPGAQIITTGDGTARSATTNGVSFAMEKGVHVFGGAAAAPARDTFAGASRKMRIEKRIEIELNTYKKPWRRLRDMRTQGFYSGIAYPSRQYTQGFFADQ